MLTSPFIAYDSLQAAMEDCEFNAQAEVLAYLLDGANVMISGPAGAGKTTVIRHFIETLKAQPGKPKRVMVTASTGIAATLIGGQTVHSWCGLGVEKKLYEPGDLSDDKKKYCRDAIRATDVLIIDEISMLPAWFFTSIDLACRDIRASDEPFGGIQVVVIGDFMQLPPLVREDDKETGLDFRFSLASPSWEALQMRTCYMDKKYRAGDPILSELLDRIIAKDTSGWVQRHLMERMGVRPPSDKPVMRLFSTNNAVERHNDQRLEQLPGKTSTYYRRGVVKHGTKQDLDDLIRDVGANAMYALSLKPGAQVMVTANLKEAGLSNGEIGTIESIDPKDKTVTVSFDKDRSAVIGLHTWCKMKPKPRRTDDDRKEDTPVDDLVLAEVVQLPLKLAWAITIHKSQGQTFDHVEVDLGRVHTEGLGYVALSRVRSMDHLFVSNLNDRALAVSEDSTLATGYIRFGATQTRKHTLAHMSYYIEVLTSAFDHYQAFKAKTASGSQNEGVDNLSDRGTGEASYPTPDWVVPLRGSLTERLRERTICPSPW